MKTGKRLYISLTNDCTTTCPFCCMNSGAGKKTYLSFDQYRSIIDGCETNFELQLEGGEPLIHADFWLYLEYAMSTGRCSKVIIVTNGERLERFLPRLVTFHDFNRDTPLELKISVNYWLLKVQANHLDRIERVIFATKHIPDFSVTLNVRERVNDDFGPLLEKRGLLPYSNIYKLQSYGRLTGSPTYSEPVIVQNIEDWELYGSDGSRWGQDLIARADAESMLP